MVKLKNPKSYGYSLIEILVAFAILGILIPPLAGLFINSFAAVKNAGHRTIAANLSREGMELVKASGYEHLHASYTAHGTYIIIEDPVPGYPLFKRITTVEDYAVKNPNYIYHNLLFINVTVSWSIFDGEHLVSIDSLLADRRRP